MHRAKFFPVHHSAQTVTVFSNLVLAMVLYPETLKRAQAEIDDITGGSRLPDFEDRGSLPYLDCVLSEVLRYDHASLPHYVTPR